MGIHIKICGIHPAYLDYLRAYDPLVSLDPKHNRKFVGIIFEVNGHKYYAPLSSPKPKHRTIPDRAVDIVKIDGGKLGVINLNNMIPVHESAVIGIDISHVADVQYRGLLTNQALFIRSNEQAIKKKASRLYSIVKSQKQPKLNARCCNYIALEAALFGYNIVPAASQDVAASKEE
ncbi:hypothetical protein AMQ84_02150 [Paenibacillus riograndensis]|uniref:Type III toxin-antitoxin system ToxN/AbiQ family toxin n=1 Tax=Paenibacillus riograndensis TaxID=483937 RepID=A0A132UBE3_9BACL|nr:type III toxin-antitoxin system ToxN/AbiQ family toxin [Paenibacillus riograndensis]KWX80838.1 hypothetical protein AMQ84_02150 [Paenibacillus riograndensis]